MIPFNKPCDVGTEKDWVQAAIANGHISGNGPFGEKVQQLLEEDYGFGKAMLTHSCTGALEMAAMLCGFLPGDEVILPSFTHVGTANAFERAGARLVFADSTSQHPNIDAEGVAALIGPRTRAVVVVHYAGVGCDMQRLQALCAAHNLLLIEDAAHAIGAQYQGQWLGTFGQMAAFSFHETKNITCGQGGMLVLNDLKLSRAAANIWENGTNREAFLRGEIDRYTWVSQGSCFTLSDLNAAYLYGQLQAREAILARRQLIWQQYWQELAGMAARGLFELPWIPEDRLANGHIFYLRLADQGQRDALIQHLRNQGVHAVFHYIPLHSSTYFAQHYLGNELPACQAWSECILRLPLYDSLQIDQQKHIVAAISNFFETA